ncbi:Mu-like prophage I protein [Phycisphaerae bacterium RAS2]|nr:Mu-like prophage I protein [Phycisphaerae bacterium RAS2]
MATDVDVLECVATEDRGGLSEVVMESAGIGQGEPPAEVLVAPWGRVRSTAGDFVLDEESARATMEAFSAHGTDVPIDYEHQTLGGAYSSPDGLAPAAGWIKALKLVRPEEASDGRAAGLWAEVQWTPEAAAKLASRQYRYVSPVALVRRSDRRLVGLHSAALTNKPAIIGMQPVVNGGGGATAPGDAGERLRRLLVLDESATQDVVLIAAADRIAQLEDVEARRMAATLVAEASSSGKLAPAQRSWAFELALRDPEEFKKWADLAPVVVPMGRFATARVSAGPDVGRPSAIEAAARAEYLANRPFLERLCSEEAYVADRVRIQGANGE